MELSYVSNAIWQMKQCMNSIVTGMFWHGVPYGFCVFVLNGCGQMKFVIKLFHAMCLIDQWIGNHNDWEWICWFATWCYMPLCAGSYNACPLVPTLHLLPKLVYINKWWMIIEIKLKHCYYYDTIHVMCDVEIIILSEFMIISYHIIRFIQFEWKFSIDKSDEYQPSGG